MNDRDLARWAEQSPPQRRYSLQRRQWCAHIGDPIKTEPRSAGRRK